METNIKTRFIFTFTARGVEEAIYDNGVLQYSYVYQRRNGTDKVNKYMKYINNNYVLYNGEKVEKLTIGPVYYNLVCLYLHEPVASKVIYSDKYERLLPIIKLCEHHYKIGFPDDSNNEYYYENGTCKRIETNQTFFSAVMELK